MTESGAVFTAAPLLFADRRFSAPPRIHRRLAQDMRRYRNFVDERLDDVVDAFNDVSSAQGDQETLALAADAYASELGPRSRGQKAALLEEARAGSTERIARSEAEISRFLALQKEARNSPEATRISLRNDLLEAVGSRVNVLAAGEGSEIRLPDSQ
mgnify:CR=1 FL=1